MLSVSFLPLLVELLSSCSQAGNLQQRCQAAAKINRKHLGIEINPQKLHNDILTKNAMKNRPNPSSEPTTHPVQEKISKKDHKNGK